MKIVSHHNSTEKTGKIEIRKMQFLWQQLHNLHFIRRNGRRHYGSDPLN